MVWKPPRTARYRFLEDVAGRLGARYVVTAHTADDQAETILHRILRGTGIRGLSGMARARPLGHATLIRPLLGISRAELQAYLDAIGQPYRRDPTNAEPRFTRNRIRRQLLPWLRRKFNGEVDEALLRLGALAGQSQAVIDRLVDEWFDRCVTITGPHAAQIDLDMLADQPDYLIRELLLTVWRRMGWPLRSMGSRQWDELREMAAATTSPVKRIFPGGVSAIKTGAQLVLRK